MYKYGSRKLENENNSYCVRCDTNNRHGRNPIGSVNAYKIELKKINIGQIRKILKRQRNIHRNSC